MSGAQLRELQSSPEYREWMNIGDKILEETDGDRLRELMARSEELEKTETVKQVLAESDRLHEKWGYSEDVWRVINGQTTGWGLPKYRSSMVTMLIALASTAERQERLRRETPNDALTGRRGAPQQSTV